MRYFIPVVFSFLFAFPLQAQTGIPENSFWYEPKNFAIGETVTFTAVIYNNENAETVFTVAFLDTKKKNQEKQIVIPAHDARAVFFDWKATIGEHTFEAAIQSARSGGKTIIVDQKIGKPIHVGGTVGDGRIGQLEDVVKTKSRSIFATIDSWRIKKLAQYEQRKLDLKARMDKAESAEQLDMLTEPERFNEAAIESRPFVPTPATLLIYLEYFLYIALTFIFSAALFFYIASGLLLFLVLRFFYVRMI